MGLIEKHMEQKSDGILERHWGILHSGRCWLLRFRLSSASLFFGACNMAGQERAEHFLMEADDESADDSLNMKQSET